jgi:hypothetical protein
VTMLADGLGADLSDVLDIHARDKLERHPLSKSPRGDVPARRVDGCCMTQEGNVQAFDCSASLAHCRITRTPLWIRNAF